jgi:hypothetical protein
MVLSSKFCTTKREIILEILGQILQKAIKDAGISPADAASHMGVSETNLYRLFKKDSFEVSYLKRAASLLNLPLSHFLGNTAPNVVIQDQIGHSNQSGSGNNQNVRGNNSPSISGNNSKIDLTIDDCKQQLLLTQREVEYLKSQLARADALVEAKDQTITLLKGRFDRPN